MTGITDERLAAISDAAQDILDLIARLRAAEAVVNACHAIAPGIAMARTMPDEALIRAWLATKGGA